MEKKNLSLQEIVPMMINTKSTPNNFSTKAINTTCARIWSSTL